MNKKCDKEICHRGKKKNWIASVIDKAGMLGITEKSCSEPITKDQTLKYTRPLQEQK